MRIVRKQSKSIITAFRHLKAGDLFYILNSYNEDSIYMKTYSGDNQYGKDDNYIAICLEDGTGFYRQRDYRVLNQDTKVVMLNFELREI